jgi:hypothetical protein
MADAKQLGLEMFHVDAGWFRDVGDWYPNLPKFPHGLAYMADAAHKQGMRFGLWVDWTQAALSRQPARSRSAIRKSATGSSPTYCPTGNPRSSKAKPSISVSQPHTTTSKEKL